jgi:hypothetical protein
MVEEKLSQFLKKQTKIKNKCCQMRQSDARTAVYKN